MSHWRGVLAAVSIACVLAFGAYIVQSGKIFWDFSAYRGGVAAFLAGADAYDGHLVTTQFGADQPFVYPPLVLHCFAAASWLFTQPAGLALLLLIYLAALAAIPCLLLPRSRWRTDLFWMSAVTLAAFGLAGAKLALSGNVSAILTALVLATLQYGVRRGNYAPFWAAVAITCQIKIYYFCFAIVPVLFDRKLLQSAWAGVAVVASYALSAYAWPVQFAEFTRLLSALTGQAGYVGTSVMSAADTALAHLAWLPHALVTPAALAIHALYALALLGFAYLVLQRSGIRASQPEQALLWVFTASVLISPRLLPYDRVPLTIPILLFLQAMLPRGGAAAAIAVAALCAAASVFTTPLADTGLLIASVGIWFAMGVQFLLDAPGTAPPGVESA